MKHTPMEHLASLSTAPLRKCNSLHTCCLCPHPIVLGDLYYDRGYGKRAHRACVAAELQKPTEKK